MTLMNHLMLIIIWKVTYKVEINCLHMMLTSCTPKFCSLMTHFMHLKYTFFFLEHNRRGVECQQASYFSLSSISCIFLLKTAVFLLMNGEHGRHDLPQVLFGHGVNAGADILTVSMSLFWRTLTWRYRTSGSFMSTVGQHSCHKTRSANLERHGLGSEKGTADSVFLFIGIWVCGLHLCAIAYE